VDRLLRRERASAPRQVAVAAAPRVTFTDARAFVRLRPQVRTARICDHPQRAASRDRHIHGSRNRRSDRRDRGASASAEQARHVCGSRRRLGCEVAWPDDPGPGTRDTRNAGSRLPRQSPRAMLGLPLAVRSANVLRREETLGLVGIERAAQTRAHELNSSGVIRGRWRTGAS
jgi:hypothetical protein